ncbi:glycosyltransferase family 2 protein [Ramlibacter ginsenosidimutans]|uniref:Glycosyltransferase family 2 protein n=1 Tax=Ramlibacter ginsenosidimutans TaxID=502333 RepID=A0A934TR65_9BURK|nr:glycosyltransferase family 2 protein [Ramlibacter ginsenosidimutans]MBK6005212.1 glycosyltransferase family 2 protein [Ramlibacter ginsenosidimutans]
MRLVVVTVNYCCADAILERLEESARQIAACDGEWWIVDNHSPDNSAERISRALARYDNVHLMRAEENGGFGFGNNQVIHRVVLGQINADYLYFLNPDASPLPGSIEQMTAYLDEHPEVGIVGSGLLDDKGNHTDSMFRFPSFWSEVESSLVLGPVSRLLSRHRQSLGALDRPGPVDWVAGTSFMVRAEVFRAVGGFDEEFFLYWEEVELCHRVKKAGFAVHALPSAKVAHVGGVSTGMHRPERRIPSYWHRSRNLYFRKTRSGGPLLLLNLVTSACILARRAKDLVRGRPAEHPHFLRDHLKHAFQPRRR